MRAYVAFTKKECVEFIRNYKLLVLGLIFLLFGMISPLAARYMPEMMAKLMPEGIQITIPDPIAADAWAQFLKNISQIGLFVVVILYSGVMSTEYMKGTLVHLVTKGLKRPTVVFAKFTAALMFWTGAYAISFLVSLGYTWFYWRADAVMTGLGAVVFGLWLFGILLLSVTLLGSTLFKNSYGGLLFTGTVVVLQMLLDLIPKLQIWNPMELLSKGSAILLGQVEVSCLVKPSIAAVVICGVCLAGACVAVNRKQL